MSKIQEIALKYASRLKDNNPGKPLKLYLLIDEEGKRYHRVRSGFSGVLRRYVGKSALMMTVQLFLNSKGIGTADPQYSLRFTEDIPDEELKACFPGWTTFKQQGSAQSYRIRKKKTEYTSLFEVRHPELMVTYYVTALPNSARISARSNVVGAARHALHLRSRYLSDEEKRLIKHAVDRANSHEWEVKLVDEIDSHTSMALLRKMNEAAMVSNLINLRIWNNQKKAS